MLGKVAWGILVFIVALPVSAATWYVDVDATGLGTGASWGDAFTDIQSGITAAAGAGEVWVAEGTYTSTTDPVVTLSSGVAVYGGFAATETALGDRDWEAHVTTIDGENARRCVIGADSAVLDGFTVTQGNILGHGGGMFNDGVSPAVANCQFINNTVTGSGTAGGRGGGMYNASATTSVTNCTFTGNVSSGGGGGMYNYLGSPSVTNCIFTNNEASTYYTGGGMYNSESSPTIINSIFYGNTAYCGGGIGGYKAAATVVNCVIHRNTADSMGNTGGGVFSNGDPAPTFTNCIIWTNSPENIYDTGTTSIVNYSNVQWSWPGTGNISVNPRFVNSLGFDLRLQATSPSIDTGDNSVVTVATDLDGNPRIVDTVDMGAYEYFTINVSDTSPAENAVDVAADSNVTATLTADLGTVTGSSQVLSLHSGMTPFLNGTNVTLTYDNTNPYVLTLDPASDFHPGERVFANYFMGDFGTKPYTWGFRVAASPLSVGAYTDSGFSLGTALSDAVALGDLDGDGDLDAFVGNYSQANTVWMNDGAGGLTNSGQSLGVQSTVGVALGDVDGNGTLDVAVANGNGGFCEVWTNNGAGVFSNSGQYIDGGGNVSSIALADLDGDGTLDILIGCNGDPDKFWTNDGTGAFSDTGQEIGWTNTSAMALGDLDEDGYLDAFIAVESMVDEVSLNQRDGSFSSTGQDFGWSTSLGCALGDLDDDGHLDVFIAKPSGNEVWTGDGTGAFTNTGQTLGSAYCNDVALGDVDGDGDLDVFAANGTSGANQVWLNDGSAAFTDAGQALGASESTSVALGDLDGDGTIDAFVTNYSQANKVWLNTSRPMVVTDAATDVMATTATMNGEVTAEGGQPVTERGFYWSNTSIDTSNLGTALQATVTPDPGGTGTFSCGLSGLPESTPFFYVAYAVSAAGTTYGAEESFTTKTAPIITWADPAPITYGTALDGTQLNASANVPGTFVYDPPAGTVLDAGLHALDATFTPDDAVTYSGAVVSVDLVVNVATPSVTAWPTASAITYGDALSASSLSGGTASTPGTFAFDAPATAPDAGTYTADVTFTPDDAVNYNTVGGTVDVTVNKAAATVTLGDLSHSFDGLPKSASATTNPAGLTVTFTYDGGTELPVAVGSYAVVATVDDPNYMGSASDTLTIAPMPVETIEVSANTGDDVLLEVPSPGSAGAGDFVWTYTPEGGSESPISGADGPSLLLPNVVIEDSGLYTATYDNEAKVLGQTVFDLTVANGLPASGGAGLALLGLLTALSGARVLRSRKK